MNLEAPWAYAVLMALVLGLAASPLLRFLDEPAAPGARHAPIDGLRGFLALGVFVYHLVVTHGFVTTGAWAPPRTPFYALLGPVGVTVFFMLTGYLFWGKLLRARGRPDWRALYVGRLFRIGPMYLVVVLVMLGIVFARSGFALREPPQVVAGAVLQWLALGLLDGQPDVNGEAATHVLAGVTWTLWYEWVFYASLVASAAIARRRDHAALVIAAAALCLAAKMLWRIDAVGFAALFALGMAVASLQHDRRLPALPERVASTLALACLALPFVASASGYGSATALLLAAFFALVCQGSTLFGLLLTRAAQRLGRISYSLYLMQGLLLTAVFAPGPVRAFALASPAAYWAAGIACACALLACAALGYVAVERPGIALGRRLLHRAHARRVARLSAP